MSRVDRRLGAALVLIALAWLWMVYAQIPDAGTEWPGPRGFPVLLGIILAVLGLLLASVLGRAKGETGAPTGDPESRHHEARVAAGTFALLILYAFLFERAGFLIATPLLIALTMAVVLRIRRWWFISGMAAAFSVGCWVVFNTLLGIPLPRGTWIEW